MSSHITGILSASQSKMFMRCFIAVLYFACSLVFGAFYYIAPTAIRATFSELSTM